MRTPLPVRTADELLSSLKKLADPKIREVQARFGITPARSLGIRMPQLRQLARCQKNHDLAESLWQSGIHEARILASMVDEVKQVTCGQMEDWAADFDSWDVCDLVIIHLFHRTEFAYDYAREWIFRQPEYVCRAGFVLIAVMAVHRNDIPDEQFLPFFPLILNHTYDNRTFVNKASNWALRQMGKRSPFLREEAIITAGILSTGTSPAARWAGMDALRELRTTSPRRKTHPDS
jgi:3-methyladenine DNA glycosylase AlkD